MIKTSLLTATLSFWERKRFFSEKDFIIIGAGLAGLWCAYEIKKKFPDQSVLILERGKVPSGASSKNAGFACFGSATELLSETSSMGWDRMLEIAEMRYRGIEKIKSILGEKNIGYNACGGYECIDKKIHDIPTLKSQIRVLNDEFSKITRFHDTFHWVNGNLETFGLRNFDGLIENNFEGGLDSGLLLKSLELKVQEMGVEILYATEVASFEESAKGVKINTTTERGFYFAHRMIVCTNAFISEILPGLDVKPARGQVLITKPIPGLKLRGTFHYNEGYYYFRNVGNRVLLGGARNIDREKEETKEFSATAMIQSDLEMFLKRHLGINPTLQKEGHWSGIMAFTPNKEPTIYHPSPLVYGVVCCNGMGVALSPIIAEKLVKQL